MNWGWRGDCGCCEDPDYNCTINGGTVGAGYDISSNFIQEVGNWSVVAVASLHAMVCDQSGGQLMINATYDPSAFDFLLDMTVAYGTIMFDWVDPDNYHFIELHPASIEDSSYYGISPYLRLGKVTGGSESTIDTITGLSPVGWGGFLTNIPYRLHVSHFNGRTIISYSLPVGSNYEYYVNEYTLDLHGGNRVGFRSEETVTYYGEEDEEFVIRSSFREWALRRGHNAKHLCAFITGSCTNLLPCDCREYFDSASTSSVFLDFGLGGLLNGTSTWCTSVASIYTLNRTTNPSFAQMLRTDTYPVDWAYEASFFPSCDGSMHYLFAFPYATNKGQDIRWYAQFGPANLAAWPADSMNRVIAIYESAPMANPGDITDPANYPVTLSLVDQRIKACCSGSFPPTIDLTI